MINQAQTLLKSLYIKHFYLFFWKKKVFVLASNTNRIGLE